MIRKIFFALAAISLAALTTSGKLPESSAAGFAAQTSGPRFGFTEISLKGTSKVPFMRVSWAPAGFKPGEIRIEGYTLVVELSGNGETGRVAQTPSPSVISVPVAMLGIPTEQRIKLFGGSSSISATVTLTARIIQNGVRKEVREQSSTSFRPLPNSGASAPTPTPAPKPRPDRKEIIERLKEEGLKEEGLKKKVRIIDPPKPTPTPKKA